MRQICGVMLVLVVLMACPKRVLAQELSGAFSAEDFSIEDFSIEDFAVEDFSVEDFSI